MAYNSGKGTDGAGATSTGINSISLPWTTDVRLRTGAVDAAYSNDNSYYHVHGYQPGRQRDIAPHYPTIETSLSHEYDDWMHGLLGTSSTLALPGSVNGAAGPHSLEDELLSSRFQEFIGDNSQDLSSLLHQDRWHMPNFSADADVEGGLTEDTTNFVAPGPSFLATCTDVGAGVAPTEAGPSNEVLSASGHDSLYTALDTPAKGSSKKRKMRALDLESDTEDVPKIAAHSLKKRRVRNPSPTPPADSEQGDVAEGNSTMNVKQIVKQKTRHSKLLSSRDYRKRTSSGIASLRERVFPGSVKKGTRKPRVAAGKNMDKGETNETSELDVILEACEKLDEAHEEIKQVQDMNNKLEDTTKELEEKNKMLEDNNKKLQDDMQELRDEYEAINRDNAHLRWWIAQYQVS